MNNNLGKIIIELRNKNNYTQKDLAEKLNVSDKAISRWETGASIPHVEMLVRISKLFKISLQDLIVSAAQSDETDDELVEDIIKEFTKRDKDKTTLIKILSISSILAVLILIISIIFIKSYNRFKVYDVYLESDSLYASVGIYVETRIKDSLYLNGLKIRNYEVKNDDLISIDLYYMDDGKEYILNNYSSLDNIHFVDYESYIKIDDLSKYLNDIYLRVRIIDKKNNQIEYTGKLQFTLNFSNNKIFVKNNEEYLKKQTITFSPKEIRKILLHNGFKSINDITVEKIINGGFIYYFSDSNIINVSYEKDKLRYNYIYQILGDIIKVVVTNENNIEIENYRYDAANAKMIECVTGSCNNYKKVIEFFNKNILLYLK